MATIATLQRITAPKLAEMLLARSTAIGTESSSKPTTAEAVEGSSIEAEPGRPSLAIIDVRDDDHIGGHICSSQHFPSRSLDATMPTLLRQLRDTDVVVFHCALSQQRGPGAALQYLRQRDLSPAVEGAGKKQTVYVLDRGFTGWQELYGMDERLTEGYRKDLWQDY